MPAVATALSAWLLLTCALAPQQAPAPAAPVPAPAAPLAESAPPTLLVAGFANHAEGERWRDLRLGMGLGGRLAQLLADSGAFALVEEKSLAPSVREAVGGIWLREREDPGADLAALHAASGAAWIAHGSLDRVAVTRDRVTGIVGGRRWTYRAELTLCLHRSGGGDLCRQGEGKSTTTVVGAVVEYRGNEVAFDQAGPAQAIDRALLDAFNRLLPEWEKDA